MAWIAAIAAAVVGGIAADSAADKSAGAVEAAAEKSAGEQGRQFNTIRRDTQPYRQVGVSALDKLARLYGLGGVGQPKSLNPMETQELDELRGLLVNSDTGDYYTGNAREGSFWDDKRSRYAELNRQNQLSSQAGTGGLSANATPDMSQFFTSPEYQFNLAEGQKAIDRSLAARGRSLSGAGLKEGVRYASGMASNQFGDFYNRLANLAGIGQSGVNTSASAGMNAAGNIGNSYMQAGNARASAYMARGEGINNAVQGGISNYLLGQYLNQPNTAANPYKTGWA